MATTPVLYSTVVRTSRKSDGMCMFDEELNKALKCLKTFVCRWRRCSVLFRFNLVQHWETRLVQIKTNTIADLVRQSIYLQEKETLVFSWLLFTSIWKTPCRQIPAYLVPKCTVQRFWFLPGVYKQVQWIMIIVHKIALPSWKRWGFDKRWRYK